MSVARRPNIDPERLAVLWLGFDQGMTLFTITLMIGISFIFTPLAVVPMALVQRDMDFRKTAFVEGGAHLVNALVSIAAAWQGYSAMSLAFGVFAYQFTRAAQDEYALQSLDRAKSAITSGAFKGEIAAVGAVETDEQPGRAKPEKIPTLKPAFREGGTVTAATASPFTDGSAAVLVCGEDFLKRHDLKPLARIVSFAVSGCEPGKMGLGPIESSRKALKRAGMTIADMGVIEMNEAFASQAEASRRALDIDPDILNVDGGAIALGHPLGATGARLVGKCATLLHRENKRYGLATQCMGGGMGIAMVLEAA